MEESVARDIARSCHRTQRTRHGSPMYAHVERVAAAVELEPSPLTGDELVARGLSPDERSALLLLTRAPAENYTAHVHRIADGGGIAGRLARAVKLADLDDHLAVADRRAGDPPYAWARRVIRGAQRRHGDDAPSQDDHRVVAV
jgi:hypothetical protein